MVFESIVTDVVNRFLGDYIENLDKKQLNLGIWGGDVVLKNLLVKASAFEDLDLPIQVVYGRLGKLVLKVPWKNLYGSPVVAIVEDLYVLVAPNSAVAFNEEKETKRAKEIKQAELLKIEEAKKLELEKDKHKERPDQSFTEKLVAQIINNVQITIKNVHIRYEDRTTAATPFSVGITLSEFIVHTTDEHWQKCFLKEQASKIFKIAELEGLSVYLNCNSKMYLQHTVEEYPALFVKGIATKEYTPENWDYVLGPINSLAKLQLNMNPEYDSPPFKIPKILLAFDMEKLAVGITRSQYQSLMCLADGMGAMTRAAPYRKYRPFGIPFKGHYKEWWHFAYASILETEIKRQTRNWSWEHIKNHRKALVMYAAAYKTKITSKKPSAECLATCERCEDQLDIMNLTIVRQKVDLEIKKSGKAAKEVQAQSSGWFGGWFGNKHKDDNGSPGEDKDILNQFKSAMTAEEKEKLCQAIGYEEGVIKTELPNDYVAISANFTLKLLEICVRNEVYDRDSGESLLQKLEDVVTLKLGGVSVSANQRPSTNGLLLDVNMKEFDIYGYQQDDYHPVLVNSKTQGELALLDIQFEMNPLDGLCDQRVSISSRPLHIVYDAQTIIQVLHVFKPPTHTNLTELQDAASNKLGNISERSATGIQYMIEKHTRLDVNIELMPNYILIPYGGAYAKNKVPVLVVSLGKIMFKSEPRPLVIKDVASMATAGATSHDILQEMLSQSYDKFNLSIQDIQILLARPTESWEDALSGVITEMHMLEPTSVELSAHMCVVDDDPRLPKMRFGGKIPSIGICVSDDRVLETLSLVTSIPLPQSDEEVVAPSLKRDGFVSSTLSLKKYLEDRHKKPKKPEVGEIGEEIVQYTDMEVHFEMKELSLSLYKAREYRETPSDEYQTPTEEFQSGSLNSKHYSEPVGSEAEDNGREKLLTFKVEQLEMAMMQRTYDMNVSLKLGAICMDQHTRQNGKEMTLTMVHTPQFHDAGNYLFSLSFIQANKISPEFTTKYKSTEQLIDINFAILKLKLHQEGLTELMQIANSFQLKLEAINKKNETLYRIAYADDGLHLPAVPAFLATISEEPTAGDLARQTTSSRRAKVVDSVKMKVLAHLEHFAVELEHSHRKIAILKIKNVNASVIMKSSYTEVGVVLQDIQVIDLNPATAHPMFLSVIGGNALSCQIVLYNLDETSVYNSDNMKIDISLGCVKIVFLNWFISSVLNFLDNFQEAQKAIADASAAAADAAKQNVVDAYANATRMKLNLKIKAPLIIVPVDSQSMEAIAVDLGFLCISNSCSELAGSAEERGPAVLDEIKLEMRDMKLSKIKICKPENTRDVSFSRLDSERVHSAYGIKNHVNLLNPTSFALLIKRNLSASWYKKLPELDISGKLNSIVLNILGDDYKMIMLILSKNLSEGANERKAPPPPPPPSQPRLPVESSDVLMDYHISNRQSRMDTGDADNNDQVTRRNAFDTKISDSPSKISQDSRQSVNTFLKFSFHMDSIILNLFTAPDIGLAQFGIYYLSLKGYTLADGSMSASAVICDVQLDDTRPKRQNYITKFMKKRDTNSDFNQTISAPDSSMIDIVARIKGDDTFAKLKISSFDLILSLEYLMKIADFLSAPEDKSEIAATSHTFEVSGRSSTKLESPSLQSEVIENKKNIQILLELAEPDIILVEKMDDINCLAIILNTEIKLDVRMQGDTQKLKGELTDMRIYVCEFNPARRNTTKHFILQPFTVSLHGSTTEESGMNVSLQTTDVRINVSPGIIEILNKAMTTMTGSSLNEEDEEKALTDYSDIWDVKELDESKYWFMKIEQAEEVLDHVIVPVVKKSELCIVEVPSLVLVIETGFGYYTQPMLIVETKLCAEVRDWSSNMAIKSSLALGMAYNNSALATWEPLIEPNERENSNGIVDYHPWELNFDLSIVKNQTEDGEEQPTTKIDIASSDALEMTITKSFLETLQDLGKSFSDAIKPSGLSKPSIIAPYIVENDTGFPITLSLKNSSLHLHSSHLPTSQAHIDTIHSAVVFQAKTIDTRDIEPQDVTSATISPGGRAYLQPKDDHALAKLSAFTEQNGSQNVQDMMLYATIGDIDKEICLPIHKTDQRYFPLYRDTNKEPWGIISNVKTEYGTTVITIHGVLKIFNHFSTTIVVHRLENSDYTEIGSIPAHSEFHVPLHALYAVQKELFFSVDGYNVSVQGINWKEAPSDFQFKKNLQCDPVSTYEPFYILAIREREEVFHEISSKITMLSACFTIHLRPQLYLKNALPIDVFVSVAGCTVSQTDVAEALEDDSISSKNPVSSTSQKDDFLDYGEKTLKPGDLLHLPTVKTYAVDGDNKSYVVLRLIQYLEKDWSCTTEIPSNPQDFSVWTFNSYDSVDKMSLELGVHFENCHGTMQATIYCPFWMINKTGLMLSYRPSDESINVLYHPPDYDGPILFSFREKVFFGKKKASLRVDSGEWSDKFALDAAGSTGVVECKANNMGYEIGVHNTLTHNSLTKQVTFVPFYVMMNKAPFAIEVQENQRPADPWTKIEANQCVPLWPKDDSKMLRVRACDTKHVSRPFKFVEVQCTLLKMENQYGGINVDVQVTEGAVFITFSGYFPGDAPALIINHSNTDISFSEKGNINQRLLKPKQEMLYTWSDPAGDRVIQWNDDNNKVENDLRRDGVDQFKLPSYNSTPIYWVSFLDGTQRVLLFTEETALANDAQSSNHLDKITQDITLHLQGIGISLVNNIKQIDIMYLGIASSGVIWEEKKKNRFKPMKIQECQVLEERYQEFLRDKVVGDCNFKSYHLDGNKIPIDFEGMKIRKSNEREIKRTFYPGVWVEMKSSPYQMQLHAKVNRIQIDNQLTDCIFPVVLAPVPPPKSVAATTELKPFIECSIVQRIIPHSTVKQFKYLTMLIQEFHVKVDLLYITEILNMISVEISEEESAQRFTEDLKRQQEPLSALVQTFSTQDQKNFYDMLHLGPLKIHISFSMAGMEPSALPGVLSTVLQGIGVTLTDINDVVLRLAFFQRDYTFFTQNQLISEITSHYTGQAVKQAYVLIFGLDVIGNPYGLVVGFTKGVEDLFYEPFSGAIQGPGEFAEGLVLGVRSLFGHTVGGAAGAVSKITGAMGKGLAALTFDKEYQKKRREQLNKKPANLQEGIARSGKGLVMGVVDGVTGVFTKPISGAKSEGVEGFFKGLGKGAVGLVARPTAGIVDFASGSFDAVKRATEMSEDVNRLRSPRFLHSDGIVRPFSRAQAEGNKLLKEIEKGKYANTDTFAHFEVIIEKRDVLLLSYHRVLYCVKNDLFGGWQIDWTYRWCEIGTIASTERGVEILLTEKGKKFGLFSSSEKIRKVVLIPQRAKRDKLAVLMNELRDSALI